MLKTALHLALLAELEAKKAQFAKAEGFYERAADVVEGLLINVPSRQVESSLIATESQLYLGHFSLAATKLRNINKAYEVLETARGRSIADALPSEPVRPVRTDPITEAARKEVNRIQLALLHDTDRGRRENLLERLFQAEQVLAPVGKPQISLTARCHPRPPCWPDHAPKVANRIALYQCGDYLDLFFPCSVGARKAVLARWAKERAKRAS